MPVDCEHAVFDCKPLQLYETDSCVAFKRELLQGPTRTRDRLPLRHRSKPRLAGYRLQRRLQDLDDA